MKIQIAPNNRFTWRPLGIDYICVSCRQSSGEHSWCEIRGNTEIVNNVIQHTNIESLTSLCSKRSPCFYKMLCIPGSESSVHPSALSCEAQYPKGPFQCRNTLCTLGLDSAHSGCSCSAFGETLDLRRPIERVYVKMYKTGNYGSSAHCRNILPNYTPSTWILGQYLHAWEPHESSSRQMMRIASSYTVGSHRRKVERLNGDSHVAGAQSLLFPPLS
jgi:hypothetical protein